MNSTMTIVAPKFDFDNIVKLKFHSGSYESIINIFENPDKSNPEHMIIVERLTTVPEEKEHILKELKERKIKVFLDFDKKKMVKLDDGLEGTIAEIKANFHGYPTKEVFKFTIDAKKAMPSFLELCFGNCLKYVYKVRINHDFFYVNQEDLEFVRDK